LCEARSTAAKGSPPSYTITERRRLLDPSMNPNAAGCLIRRRTRPAARSVTERRRLLDPSMNAIGCSIRC
jgi:hypothetical protein